MAARQSSGGRKLPQPEEARSRTRPPHRLRVGAVPEHRRMLEPQHRDLHAAGRHLHPPMRILRCPERSPAGHRFRRTQRVAEAVATLGLKHAVITSVNRDDDNIGGAQIFAETIARCEGRARLPRRSADPGLSGHRRGLADCPRRAPERPESQHGDGASSLSRGAFRSAL